VKGNTKHFNHVLAWNVISLVSKLPFLYQVLPACPFGPLVHYGLEAKVVYSVKLGKENNGGHSHIQSKWVAQSSVFQYKLVLYIKKKKNIMHHFASCLLFKWSLLCPEDRHSLNEGGVFLWQLGRHQHPLYARTPPVFSIWHTSGKIKHQNGIFPFSSMLLPLVLVIQSTLSDFHQSLNPVQTL